MWLKIACLWNSSSHNIGKKIAGMKYKTFCDP